MDSWIAIILGGVCLLSVVIAGVVAVVVFMQRGQGQGGRNDQSSGQNTALVVLACLVGFVLLVGLLCVGGVFFVGLFAYHDAAAPIQQVQPGPAPAPQELEPDPRPASPEIPGDSGDPVDH